MYFYTVFCSTISTYAENIVVNKISNTSALSIDSQSSAIQPLTVIRYMAKFKAIDGVEPFENYWVNMGSLKNIINADISKNLGFAYSLTIGEKTKFTKPLPAGYDPQKLLEWGKYPGLNMDILHKHGFTGKGAVVAYIDLPIEDHEQYTRDNVHYIDPVFNYKNSSMHGATVLSVLTGKDTGTAPEAEVYYWASSGGDDTFLWLAKNLNAIIEKNKTLEDIKKIRMVGISNNIDESDPYVDMFRNAVKACEEAGVMVWFCGEYGAFSFIPYSDRNSYDSLVPESWWESAVPELVVLPTAGRTAATSAPDDYKYIYWAKGGLSWSMPYALGLYAIALEINPALTKNDLRKMIVDTAYFNFERIPIVDPVGFVAAMCLCDSKGYINQSPEQLKKLYRSIRKSHHLMDYRNNMTTKGKPLKDEKAIKYETVNKLPNGNAGTIYSFTVQPLDNDYIRFP